MTDSIATADVEAAIRDVTHPEIDATLVELGMIGTIETDGEAVTIDVAIPMLGIPAAVKQILSDRLASALASMDADLTVEFVEMDDGQREAFFEMEQQNWSGGLDQEQTTSSDPPF